MYSEWIFFVGCLQCFLFGGVEGGFFGFLFVQEPTKSVISAEPIKN